VKEAMFSAYVENPNEPQLMIRHILDAISSTVPLSITMKEQISNLRLWAQKRAKNATEEVTSNIDSNIPILLTRPELELERSFDMNK
jgi:hypothetical protein